MLITAAVSTLPCSLAGAANAAPQAAEAKTILVFGDSLSAAYGLRREEGWVALLEKKLAAQGYGHRVVNASVSGETTAGGLTRLPRALKLHRPALLILELGGNDGLRGLPVAEMRANLGAMIEAAQAAKARVLLVGMRMPGNYGPVYTQQFEAAFATLARQYRLPFVPFLLEGVALDAALMQADGMHPVARAQPRLLQTLWPTLLPMLKHAI